MDADGDGYGFENEGAGQFKWESAFNSGWNELLDLSQTDGAEDLFRMASVKRAGKKGLIRTLMVVIDDSRMASTADLAPNRAKWARSLLKPFISAFIEENPLGVIGLISMRDGLAHSLCSLTNDEGLLRQALDQKIEPSGDFSLQNALETCILPISNVGSHGSREILVLLSSFNSCDPGDIEGTISKLQKEKTRVCFLTMLGEYHVAGHIAKQTKGYFTVAKDELDFQIQLKNFSSPLEDVFSTAKATAKLAIMGFPASARGSCSCHFENHDNLFECPRCHSSMCRIPSQCINCGLLLILGPDLAKSYHHLFPLKMNSIHAREDATVCQACGMICESFVCSFDMHLEQFCSECAKFIDESLYVVPL